MVDINNLITDNIDVWTSAIKKRNSQGRGSNKKIELTGVKKLRELILELAVSGKLVQQSSNEEHASVLLEKIAEEKAQLIADNIIKKQKPLTAITDEEKSFELPSRWEFCKLGNIGLIFNGNSINTRLKEQRYTGLQAGLPFIATKDVDYGYKALDYNNGVLIPVDEPKFKIARKNSVLICAEGGSAGKKCGITNQDICFGNKLFANELFAGLSPKFILYTYLSPTFYCQFSESMTGIIGGISSNKFSELIIRIPPLAEQHRIVVKVDELMALCDQLEEQTDQSLSAHQTLVEVLLATLTESNKTVNFQTSWQRIADHFDVLFTTEQSIEQLKKTILQLAVMGKLVPQNPSEEPTSVLLGKIEKEKTQLIADKKIKKTKLQPVITDEEKPFELPSGWEWERVGDLMDAERDISYGVIKLEKEPDHGGIKTLRCSDVKPRYIDLSGVRTISSEIEEPYKRTRLNGGEVLVNIRGTLGGVALVPESLRGFNIAREVAMLPVNKYVSGFFIVDLISSPFFWNMIESNLKGIAYKGLNLNTLRLFTIALPPLAEQNRIVTKVDELMILCEQLKARLSEAQTTQLHLADAIVSRAVGQQVKNIEKKVEINAMKITTTLSITQQYINQDDGILALLIKNEGGEADAKAIWNKSSFDLPRFYKQLKKEIKAGHINLPAKADFE